MLILSEQFCAPKQCPPPQGAEAGIPSPLQEVLSQHFPGRKHVCHQAITPSPQAGNRQKERRVTGPQPTAAPGDRPLATCWLACQSKLDLQQLRPGQAPRRQRSTTAHRCPQITKRSLLLKSLGWSLTDGTGAQMRFAAFLPRHGRRGDLCDENLFCGTLFSCAR